MFDIGWSELLVIAVVLIVVVGPKDLPPMLRAFGKTMTRFRKVAGDFRAQFDEALREADLDDVRQTIADAQKLNPAHSLREAMNPLRQMGNDIKADLQRSTQVDRAPEPQMLPMTPPVVDLSVPEPQPVIAPPPVVVAETVAKAKAVRKPRVKTEVSVVETPPPVATAEIIASPKAVRKPRAKAEALSVEPSVPVVAEVVKTVRPRARAPVVTEPSVVEPAQVGMPEIADKPKRVPRKVAVPAAGADAPAAAPKKAAPARTPAPKKDDA